MKRIINMNKYLIGAIMGIILVSTISVFAIEGVKAVINSEEVSYDNTKSHGTYQDVQGSIDELYRRSGILDKEWKDPILNGADPVFDDTKELIPVTIADDGTVHYANLYTKWYEYETKRWANAVILVDSEKGKYKTGDEIPEKAIESYFVWIPRYKYKIWDLGKYDRAYNFSDLQDSKDAETALRHITGKAQLIDIVFQKKEEKTTDKSGECAPDSISGGGSKCHVGDYMTHPAFTTLGVNGLWVGKFEVTGNINAITVKPGVQSVRNQTVGTFWHKLYDYKRNLDSHMMKNTEWGAVAYLSHSAYGIGREVNINNNSEYKTGYSASAKTDQSTSRGIYGTEDNITQAWNTSTGYLASTTGNITGIYDMSGGAIEYMAAYVEGHGQDKSGLSLEQLNNNAKYFDEYSTSTTATSYNNRILGDATGEMGPFYYYYDDESLRYHNGWYADTAYFIYNLSPWFGRSGDFEQGRLTGQFYFGLNVGGAVNWIGSRLVLAVQ